MAELFTLSSTVERDPAIEEWLDRQPSEMGSIARKWLVQMRGCGDDVREVMHDGCPVACVHDAPFGYVNIFTAHITSASSLAPCCRTPRDCWRELANACGT